MNNRGFSLIELIVVMTIVFILLGLATITGRDWMERYRVEGQMKELYADLMNARVSALQRNRILLVKLAAGQYAIYEDTYNAGTPSSPEGDGLLQTANDRLVTQKNMQYALGYTDDTSGEFNFTQNGLASWATGTIWTTSTANPATDCIVLSTTRLLMGKMNGTTCVAK